MHMRRGLWGISMGIAGWGSCAEPVEIDRLVARLGSVSYKEREMAGSALMALWRETPDAVEKRLPGRHDDLEIHRRLADLRADMARMRPRLDAERTAEGDVALQEAVRRLFDDPSAESVEAAVGAAGERTEAAARILSAFLAHRGAAEAVDLGISETGDDLLLPADMAVTFLAIDPASLPATAESAAIRALGRLGHRSASLRIVPFLADGDARVRAEAVEALARLADPSVLPQVAALLAHARPPVHRDAARLVGRYAGESWDGPDAVERARAWWRQRQPN